MPNIPPLISSMPDAQPLYASYTVTGGGGGGVSNPMTASLNGGGFAISNVSGVTLSLPAGGAIANVNTINGLKPAVTLTNAKTLPVIGGVSTSLAPNTPTLVKAITVNSSYGTLPLSLRALLLIEVVGLAVTSITTPVSGDTLTFQFVGTVSGGTATFLSPPLVLSGASLPSTTPLPIQLNSFGDIGPATQATTTYDMELQVLYTTTGSTGFELTPSNYTLNAQVIGCVTA